MADFTNHFVSHALGISEKSKASFVGISTDSRSLTPGSLFVPLKGDYFDGHDFIPQAIKRGATGILSERHIDLPPNVELFLVTDSLEAYRKLGAAWRQQFSLPVIAVAGSTGKTTTKELLAAMLESRFRVLKTEGSENGFIGIPKTLLRLNVSHQVAVIEVGIDAIGTLQEHVKLVDPTAGILTSVGPEHLEFLKDVETVAKEELGVLYYLDQKKGFVGIHLDDPWISPLSLTLTTDRKISYSLASHSNADLFGKLISQSKIQLSFQGEEKIFNLPLLGRHNASNFLSAASVALGIGLSFSEIEEGLKNFQGAFGRSELKELVGGGLMIFDCYNSNPASAQASLELLKEIMASRGRAQSFACLADMRELGIYSEQYHRELASSLMEIDYVLLLGNEMGYLYDELCQKGYQGFLVHCGSHEEMAELIRQKRHPLDVILVKGSRSMRMEKVGRTLLASRDSTSHP